MNIVADFLLKGIIGGAGQVVATSVSKICGFALTDKVIGKLIIGLARTLAKRTKNTVDDGMVDAWEEQIVKSGIDIK